MTSSALIRALLDNKILYKIHHNDDVAIEYFFKEDSGFQKRGWGTAYGTVGDRLVDLAINPDNWKIHEHDLSMGHPYPWSAGYTAEKFCNLTVETSIGEDISPILKEIEDTLWEFEANVGVQPLYTEDGFKASIKIFLSAMLDKMWDLQEKENMPMKDRTLMAAKVGDSVRQLVKVFTDIDTHDFYKEK